MDTGYIFSLQIKTAQRIYKLNHTVIKWKRWINKCICTCHAWFDGYYDEGTWQHGFRDLTLIVESRIFQIDQKYPINGSDDYHICIVPINIYLLGNQYWFCNLERQIL